MIAMTLCIESSRAGSVAFLLDATRKKAQPKEEEYFVNSYQLVRRDLFTEGDGNEEDGNED